MNIMSYKTLPHKSEHYTWWRQVCCIALAEEIARQLFHEHEENVFLDYGILPTGGGRFEVKQKADIAFVPFNFFPDKRPADFIYTFCSDVRNYEVQMLKWQNAVKPNLIGCLQDIPDWLVEWGKQNNCAVKLMQWFFQPIFFEPVKTKKAMCSGAIGRTYPSRTEIFYHLADLKDIDTELQSGEIVLSCGDFGKYPLTTEQYRKAISESMYYLSGGIYDELIPPKYYEASNYGCCLISKDMPLMQESGFVHNETFIKIESVKEIEDIIMSNRGAVIGQNARKMIQEKHSVKVRAKQIIGEYYDYRNRNA